MHQADLDYASEKVAQLKSQFQVDILKDWGDETGTWQDGFWAKDELDRLLDALNCFAEYAGGPEKVGTYTGGVTVRKADMGSHGGEALSHRVSLLPKAHSPPGPLCMSSLTPGMPITT